MCDEWMSRVQIRASLEQFQKLPRHPAYRYLYHQEQIWISPQPRFYHALIQLPAMVSRPVSGLIAKQSKLTLDFLKSADWSQLISLFSRAFAQKEPLASLQDEELDRVAAKCLNQTRQGGDGLLLESASVVAYVPGLLDPVGACLITLLPDGDPRDPQNYYPEIREDGKRDPFESGRPHLTWIFVDPALGRQGIATQMFQKSAQELVQMGYSELASTFLLGNTESMLWHWRNQFQVLAPS